ncbi:MAG: ferrochelatase [Coriobacteriia bacterium]|nr:ferrochelatase [Coriobacteriia bacterium]
MRCSPCADTGILLVNTGTPDAPTPEAIRAYLAEFLRDRHLIDIPSILWLPILYGIILRTRPPKSAERYQAIWTKDGSPLLCTLQAQAAGVEERLLGSGYRVKVRAATRYGNPSIAKVCGELQQAGCERLVIMPLYPQQARVITGSIRAEVERLQAHGDITVPLTFIDDYYRNERYLDVVAASVREAGVAMPTPNSGVAPGARLLFSFHSTLKKDIEQGDPYLIQVQETVDALVERLDLAPEHYALVFPCRFDRRAWLGPTPEVVLERWAEEGVRDVAVVYPGFSADCLETLYDGAVELRAYFATITGEQGRLTCIPALNDRPDHLDALCDVLEERL